jgi:hypothetical protein
MCRSLAEGGQRCAAHTRAAYSIAQADVGLGVQDADHRLEQASIAYASTDEGQEILGIEATKAADRQDWETEARLRGILRRGATLREANQEARRRLSEPVQTDSETPDPDFIFEVGEGEDHTEFAVVCTDEGHYEVWREGEFVVEFDHAGDPEDHHEVEYAAREQAGLPQVAR